MKKIHPLVFRFTRVLACGVAAATIVLGCDTTSGDAPNAAPTSAAQSAPGASGEASLSYDELLAILGDPDGFARARKLSELLPKAGPGALGPVKMVLKQTSTAELELGAADFELLMRYWALHDPAGASNYAIGASPRGYRVGAIHATVRRWMSVDPLGAIKEVRTWGRQEGDFGAATQIALVRGWYDSGQEGIEEYLRSLGPSFERQRAITTYLAAMAHDRGGDPVVDWAEAHLNEKDAKYRLDVFRGAGDALIAVDVKAAKRFCDAHCDKPYGDNVRNRVASRWIEVGEPSEAFAWLQTQPRNDETDLAVRRSFATWAELDRAAALAWMRPAIGHENNAWLHPALPIYVRLLGREVPTEALGIAERFFEGDEREFWTVEILRFWRQRDEAAAEAWLAKSSLPPETLAKVREPQTEYESLIMKQEDERRAFDANRRRLEQASS